MRKEEIATMVINDVKDIIYISDIENYKLLYINDATSEAFGYQSESEWKDQPCYKILQGREEPCEFCTNHLLKTDAYYTWERYNENLGRYFQLKDKMITMEGRKARLEVAIDVTEAKEAAREIHKKLRLEQTLVECVKTLYEKENLDVAIGKLLSIVARYHQAERAYIFEIDEPAGVLNNTYEWCEEGIKPQIDFLQRVPLDVIERWMVRFENQGEFFITSLQGEVSADSDEYKILEVQGIDSLMAAPLKIKNKIVGFLGVDNPKENTDTLLLLQSVAAFVIDDIEKRKNMAKLYELSYVDRLTGVENRHAYMEYLAELETTGKGSLGIVFADINGLKLANDTHGHEYGDDMIKRVAWMLKECFLEHVYRVGGDEFVVFCPDMEREKFEDKVERLRALQRKEENDMMSIGTTWLNQCVNIEEQVAYADKLMYINKQEYYSTSRKQDGKFKERMSHQVLEDIKQGRFRVYLQPKINLESGKIKGAEALIRKIEPDGSILRPDKFIWKYEEEEVIRHVDFFVLDRVCALIQEWDKKQYEPITVAVNFSRITLMEHNIVEKIVNICEKYQVSPKRIMIEVTETVGVMGEDELKQLIKNMNEAGFMISLDDFGTQYSSLSMLSTMNFNEVKLDKSLINNVEGDEKKRVVAEHVIQMCQELNPMFSVAEGVENESQKELLTKLHCTTGQGFYFGKPIEAGDFTEKYLKNKKE